MTKNDHLMHEAQEFIADQLKSTGEFARVEIGYKFGSSVNSILNEQSKSNIYAEIQVSLDGQEALIKDIRQEQLFQLMKEQDILKIHCTKDCLMVSLETLFILILQLRDWREKIFRCFIARL